MIDLATMLVLAAAGAQLQPAALSEPARMSAAEIATYNAKLRPDHPNYVHCLGEGELLAPGAKQGDCRTNQEWVRSGLLSGKPGTLVVEPNPKAMSQAEIRAANARVGALDPYFIKCVRSESIGSLVKRNFSCRTNRQWNLTDRTGNDEARDVMDDVRSKSWNTSG